MATQMLGVEEYGTAQPLPFVTGVIRVHRIIVRIEFLLLSVP